MDLSLGDEYEAFVEALERTPANSVTACAGWTAHDVLAHVVAGGGEVARLVDEHLTRKPVSDTRGFEEREKPFREIADDALRRSLIGPSFLEDLLTKAAAHDADATIPFTKMDFTFEQLAIHARSELALHRWDLVGHDSVGRALLAKPDLTVHSVRVLDGMSVLNEWITHRRERAGLDDCEPFKVCLRTADAPDVELLVISSSVSLRMSTTQGNGPCIESSAEDRLLMLWGRRPRSARSYLDPEDFRRCDSLLYA